MLHHVSVGVHDVERAAKFYDPVLKTLGYKRIMEFLPHAIGYGETRERPEFWIQLPHNQQHATAENGTHVAFLAKSKQVVTKFHGAALKHGGSNGGEPGPRPDYGPSYYGAFTYDLDGNKLEAMLMLPVKQASKAASRPTRPAAKAKKKSRR
ncbi:MAG: VOC family protein [Alphaproteobacteria bacterium]|nr:VOC family protein [Alphaproteobacteria bacterium]